MIDMEENIVITVRYLTIIRGFLFGLVLALMFLTLIEVGQLREELNSFRGSVVFDIDEVRKTLLDEMEYMYFTGCRTGIDYPPEYRKPGDYFNPNSPVNFCNTKVKSMNDYITQRMGEIGRRK